MSLDALVLGAGDLATGVAIRLFRAGVRVVMTEITTPMVVRRSVSFANAIYENGEFEIEKIKCRLAHSLATISNCYSRGEIALLVDEQAEVTKLINFNVLIDARMIKRFNKIHLTLSPFRIGLGPGFIVGENCHVVIETKRGPTMGRVFWSGSAEPDTGVPEMIEDRQGDRILRSPSEGVFKPVVEIGDIVEEGQVLALVGKKQLIAQFKGLVRGMLHEGLHVAPGTKVGDLDPRLDVRLCQMVSDKSMAVGCGVLEAIMQKEELRRELLSK